MYKIIPISGGTNGWYNIVANNGGHIKQVRGYVNAIKQVEFLEANPPAQRPTVDIHEYFNSLIKK